MKKTNKKGFILVETLVVTVFVVTLFMFVYRLTVPAIGEYEQENYYDDIDSIYYSNLYKEMLTRYANVDYIDSYLNEHTYIDVSDCNDTNVYSNVNYCQLVQENIQATDAKIFLTDYNIKDFKQEVKTNDFFDSEILSNFREYIKTVSNNETFYSKITNSTNYIGKYRLFIVRNVKDADTSTSRRFVNIGVYTGKNNKYIAGEKVVFNPGDGDKDFYVLRNSPSTEQYVTLILADNLPNSTTCFNVNKNVAAPITVRDKLRTLTSNWTNAEKWTGYSYTAPSGYTLSYGGSDYARLIEYDDIIDILGCKEDDKECFDVNEAFEVEFDSSKLEFLDNKLDGDTGYWTAMAIKNSDWWDPNSIPDAASYNYAYAWGIKKGKIVVVPLTDCTNIGIRPIIKVEKDNVIRGQ